MCKEQGVLDLSILDSKCSSNSDGLLELNIPKDSKNIKGRPVPTKETRPAFKARQEPDADAIIQKMIADERAGKVKHEDSLYKEQLVKKIGEYKRCFAELLVTLHIYDEEEKSISELENILTKIKDKVSNRNIENNISKFINIIPWGFEKGGEMLGFKLNGFSQMITADKEYEYTMKEIMIESNYLDRIKMDPKTRLMYLFGTTAFLVHTANTMNAISPSPEVPAKEMEDLKKKFDEL